MVDAPPSCLHQDPSPPPTFSDSASQADRQCSRSEYRAAELAGISNQALMG
jgi:hypothetical protein